MLQEIVPEGAVPIWTRKKVPDVTKSYHTYMVNVSSCCFAVYLVLVWVVCGCVCACVREAGREREINC